MPISESRQKRIEEVFQAVVAGDKSLPKMVSKLLKNELNECNTDNALRRRAQMHPLGFLCLKWGMDAHHAVRIHIWNRGFEWIQSPNWPIHDHVFGFKSSVLFGLIQNKTYEIIQYGHRCDWDIYKVNYTDQRSNLVLQTRGMGLKVSSTDLQPAGSTYELPAGKLHRSTLRSDVAITVLATTTYSQDLGQPRVIGGHGCQELTFSRTPSLSTNTRGIVLRSIQLLEYVSSNG